MEEVIPQTIIKDTNKLPVFATVKQAFTSGFDYIKAYPLYFGLFLAYSLASAAYMNMPTNALIKHGLSFENILLSLIAVFFIAMLQISIARHVLNDDGKLDLASLLKKNNYWRIIFVALAIASANLMVSYFQQTLQGHPFFVFVFGLVSLFITYISMRLTCYDAANATNLDHALELQTVYALTKGNFWRIVAIVILIMSIAMILAMIKAFNYRITTPPLALSLVIAVISAVLSTCLYASHALIYKHLSEKAANA